MTLDSRAGQTADQTADALDTTRKLLGQPRLVRLSSLAQPVPVRGFTFMQLFDVLSAAQPIFDAIAERPDVPLMQVFGEYRAQVRRLVHLSTGLETAVLDALPALDGIHLAQQVYQENLAFFRQELMPMFLLAVSSKLEKSSSSSTTAAAASGAAEVASAAADSQTAGPGLPIDSSEPVTAGPPSSA